VPRLLRTDVQPAKVPERSRHPTIPPARRCCATRIPFLVVLMAALPPMGRRTKVSRTSPSGWLRVQPQPAH
jgi:hypothetical protein